MFEGIDLVNGFVVPIIELTILGGILLVVCYFVGRAVYKAWTRQMKYILQYTVLRRKYPEAIVNWCVQCIEQGVGWYDAKKLLLFHNTPQKQLYETLWIYDQIISQMKKKKLTVPQNTVVKDTHMLPNVKGGRD